MTVVRLVARGTIEEKIGLLKEKKRDLAAAVLASPSVEDGSDAPVEALRGLSDADVEALLGGLRDEGESESEALLRTGDHEGERDVVLARRFVAEREVDELRAILKRVEGSGTPRKDLARKVGLPVARVSLLLIGHAVPIPTRAAEKIRALRIGFDTPR